MMRGVIARLRWLTATPRRRLWTGLGALAVLFLVFFFWRDIFIPIRSGQAGVLWSRFGGGTVMGRSYGEGYHVIFPWDEMAIYNTRLQEMHDNVDVLTADGLNAQLGVTVRFEPRRGDLPTLHERVGPNYRYVVVWPDVVAAVRHVVRELKPDDLQLMGEAELSRRINAAARDAVSRHWVDVDQVMVTRIALPKRVGDEIEAKLAEEQKALAYPYRIQQAQQEKQRLAIEGQGIRDFESTSHVSYLKLRGLEATEQLAKSPNSKIIVMGPGQSQLPVLLGSEK